MARHRQRDMEAGGEGLGVVETRKRLWEDDKGNVVNNRPSTPPPTLRSRKRKRTEPQTQPSTVSLNNCGNMGSAVAIQTPLFAHHDYSSQVILSTAFQEQLDQDPPGSVDSWGLMSPPNSVASTDASQCGDLESLLMSYAANSSPMDTFSYDALNGTVAPSDIHIGSVEEDQTTYPSGAPDILNDIFPLQDVTPTRCDQFHHSHTSITTSGYTGHVGVQTFHHCNPDRRMPVVDHLCRDRFLRTITAVGACLPDGTPITEYTPLLSLSALQTFSNSFFSDFNDAMPVIHRPSFQPAEVDPLLMSAILILGATRESNAARELASSLYDALSAVVLQHHVTAQNSELCRMQILLLHSCFGRLKGNQRQQDMARVYHTLLVQ